MFRQCRYWAATCFWALLALLFFGVLLKSLKDDAMPMWANSGLPTSFNLTEWPQKFRDLFSDSRRIPLSDGNLIVASITMNVSFHSFLSGFSKAFRRFPAAAFFFVLLTIFAIYELYDDDTVHFLMLYYPATAGMLNIVLRLLAE